MAFVQSSIGSTPSRSSRSRPSFIALSASGECPCQSVISPVDKNVYVHVGLLLISDGRLTSLRLSGGAPTSRTKHSLSPRPLETLIGPSYDEILIMYANFPK